MILLQNIYKKEFALDAALVGALEPINANQTKVYFVGGGTISIQKPFKELCDLVTEGKNPTAINATEETQLDLASDTVKKARKKVRLKKA